MGAPAAARPLAKAVAALTLAVGLVALAGSAGSTGSAHRTPPSPALSGSPARPADPGGYAVQLVQETDSVRDVRRLTRLSMSSCARSAALRRASELVGKTELVHAPLAGVITTCAPATTAAENLSRAAASPAAVVGAWMRSPGHRSNLLDPALTQIGVGCVVDRGTMLCSQIFLGP